MYTEEHGNGRKRGNSTGARREAPAWPSKAQPFLGARTVPHTPGSSPKPAAGSDGSALPAPKPLTQKAATQDAPAQASIRGQSRGALGLHLLLQGPGLSSQWPASASAAHDSLLVLTCPRTQAAEAGHY